MDFDYVAASPGGQWMGESASRRRQRRLSSPSLRAYLTPAFDAVAAGGEGGGGPGSAASSLSSGGLDLGFDDSLLRYRRTCFSASADLDSRRLVYSPPPPPPQGQPRAVYPGAADDVLLAGGYHYGSKRQAGGLTGGPGFQDFKHQFSNSIRQPADLRPPEVTILGAKAEPFSTPKPEATPLAQATSAAQAQPTEVDDDLVTEVLYGRSGRRRLPIFKEICPE